MQSVREAALRALIDMERNAAYSGAAIGRRIKAGAATGGSAGKITGSAKTNGSAGKIAGSAKTNGSAGNIAGGAETIIRVYDATGDADGYFYDISDTQAYAEMQLDARDRALLRELVYGVVRRKLTLDHIVGCHSKVKLSKISTAILNILRLGIYQIVFLRKIPAFAACDECVKLAKKYGNKGSVGFVNAMMRKVADEYAAISECGETNAVAATSESGETNAIAVTPEDVDIFYSGTIAATSDSGYADYLSVVHSYPLWLSEKWTRLYGADFASKLMEAGNRRPEMTIRANVMKATPKELSDELNATGYIVKPGKYSENALTLMNPSDFTHAPQFSRGLFSVQDESSMLCVEALEPKRGEAIMDACAAPGGKCAYMAEIAGDGADIVACDLRAHRIKLMEQNASRLGLKSIRFITADASAYDGRFSESMDKVLLDAPCSGFGVVAKKPDIKWNKTPGDVESLAKMQSAMLANVARYVKPGGILVYSVCTTEPEECEGVVDAFLDSSGEYAPDDLKRYLPASLWGGAAVGQCPIKRPYGAGLYIYPHIHGIDGFFMARLRRKL